MKVKLRDLPIHKMTEQERIENLENIKRMKRVPRDYGNHLKTKNHAYNFWKLEDTCFDTYQKFLEEDTPETRSEMFRALFEIAYAVLAVSKYVPSFADKKVAAYNYAIDYFERLVTNRFSFRAENGGDRFPFQQYTRFSIRKYIFKCKQIEITSSEFEEEVRDILDSIVYNNEGAERVEQDIIRANTNKEVIRKLYSIYSKSEIRRLAFLYRELKENNTSKDIIKKKYPDIYDFLNIIFTLSKYKKSLYSDKFLKGFSTSELKAHTDSAVKSSLFLLGIANTELLPKELFLNLDIDSIYRLSEMCGGSTITVPTKKDLDFLVLAVCSTAEKLAKREVDLDDIINENKIKYRITSCRINTVKDIISRIMDTPLIEKNSPSSEPLVNTIITSVANIEKLFDIYAKSITKKDIAPSTQVSNMVKINTMISSTLSTLLDIKHNIERKLSQEAV